MNIDISQDSPLVIAVQNTNGILVPIQELTEFLYGNRDLRILCSLHGQELFDILYDDHGLISYTDNKFALKTVIELNPNRTIMSIVGKVGESVLVRKCAQYSKINLDLMKLASGKQVQRNTASQFRAVGTGFKSTATMYPKAYNPNDTQRDIIWMDENGYHYQMAGSTSSAGLDAGIQVKVSTDGMHYVYNDILNGVYEVPVIYFDLKDDYGLIYRKLQQEFRNQGLNSGIVQDRFISGRELIPDAYDEIEYYTSMITALVNGRMKVDDLINRAGRFASFGSAIMAATMENISDQCKSLWGDAVKE